MIAAVRRDSLGDRLSTLLAFFILSLPDPGHHPHRAADEPDDHGCDGLGPAGHQPDQSTPGSGLVGLDQLPDQGADHAHDRARRDRRRLVLAVHEGDHAGRAGQRLPANAPARKGPHPREGDDTVMDCGWRSSRWGSTSPSPSAAAFSGSLFVELMFNWQGIGRFVISSIGIADVNGTVGVVFYTAILTLLSATLADFLQGTLDPEDPVRCNEQSRHPRNRRLRQLRALLIRFMRPTRDRAVETVYVPKPLGRGALIRRRFFRSSWGMDRLVDLRSPDPEAIFGPMSTSTVPSNVTFQTH